MTNRRYSVATLLGCVTYLCVGFALIRFGIDNEIWLAISGGILMIGGLVGGVIGFLLRGRKAFARGAVLAVLVLAAYPLSFGPACWIAMRINPMTHATAFRRFSNVYSPISSAIIRSSNSVHDSAMWFLELGAPADTRMLHEWYQGIAWDQPGHTYTLLSLKIQKNE